MEIKKRIEELKNNHTGLTLYSSQELKDLEKIVKLREDLDKYRDSYYNDNISLISDYEFDILLKELESLEEKYPQYKEISSPTTSVGASLKENKFKKRLVKNMEKYFGKDYKIHFNKLNTDGFYCSQYIWYIYYITAQEMGFELDLDSDGGPYVLPYDFINSPYLEIVN